MSKVAAPARRKDGREDEVNSAGVATAEHVRGSLGLGSDAAATSLYALQQVLQRDDADATAAALGRLAQNAAKKDEQALEVLDGWVRSSPRLAELFRAHAQCKTDTHLVAMFWCLRQALPRIRDDGAALEVWRRAANDWNVIRSLRRTSVCHAALEAVETAIVRVGAAAARWTVRALGADDVWQQMRQHQRNNRGGKEPTKGATTRQRCVSLASTIMRFGDTETRIAAMETGGVAASLLAKLGDDAPLRAHSLLKALRVHGVEAGDARLRSAAVSALAHEDAAAALRQVAAPRADRASDRGARQAQGEAIACLVGAAFAATDRAELVGLLRALDCCEARQRGALLTALGADGSLLPDWLRAATRGALTAVRPWDASPDAEPARRAVAGVEVLCSALGAAKHATVDYASLQSAQVAEAIVASCLPPEDVLAKKELSRGILHSSPAVKHATLQLVISILERFSIERRAAWTARGAAFCNAPDLAAAVVRRRPPPIKVLVASLLESTLVAEDSAPAAEDSAVVEPAAKRLRSDAGAAEDEDAAARAALRARLPEVQTLLTLVPKKKAVSDDAAAEDDGEADQTLSLFLAALRRYERDLPDAVADAHYDVLKLVPDVVKHWPACASQLFGVVNHAAALDHAGETVSGRLVRGRDAAAKAARATVLKAAAEPGDDAARAKACFAEALGRVGVRRGEADAWLGALRDGDDVDAFEACCVGPANADNTAPAAMIRAWLRDAHAAAPADGHVSWLLRESFRLAAERPAFATGVVHTVVVQLVSTSSNALDFAKALLREEGVLGAVAEFCRLVVADLDASTTEYDGGDEACTLRAGDVAAALIESVGVPMGVRGKRQRAGLWRCAERTDAPNLAAVAEALVQVPVPVALAHLAATIDRRNGRRLAASPWGQAVLERVVESVISGGELRSLVDALRALKFAGDRCAASPSEMAYLLGLQVRVAAAAINATKGAKSVVAAVDAALCAPSPPLWAAALAQKGAPLRSHLAAAAHLVASHLPPHRASTGLAAEALCTKLVVAAVQQRDAVGVVQRFAALASGGALEAALAACSADDAALLKALVVACFEDRRYDDADELLARPKVVAKAMGLWAASEDAQLDDVAARMARLQQRAPSVAACVPSARAQEWMRVAWARAAASDGAACGAAARVAEALARADAGCRAVACDGLAALVARLAPAKVNALAAAVAGVECCVLALAEGASDADPPGLRATALPWAAVALASQGRDAAATAVSRACGGVDFGAGAAVDFAVLSALSRASMPCQAALLACLEGHALSARAHEQAAALACDAILDGASPAEKMRAAVELLEDHADQLDQSDAMRIVRTFFADDGESDDSDDAEATAKGAVRLRAALLAAHTLPAAQLSDGLLDAPRLERASRSSDGETRLCALELLVVVGGDDARVLRLALAGYGASMSRADAAALDIFGRCGACVDGGALVDWARTRANCSGKAWIFDVLEPKRVEASLKHFPVHRRLAADPAAMSDDEEDEEDEEEEDEDRAALVYDPRFVLAALAATLALPSAGDEVNAGRRAYESGALSYAVAALASNHEDVRALAGGVVARCAAALGEAQDERGFGARASVVALLAALVAGVALRAAGDAAAGGRAGPHVPRVPALTASLAARALLSLAAPGVEGFVAAHSFALRRALLDLWRLPFCLREALSTRDAWALTCAADSARDDDDARLARNGRFLPQLIAHCDETDDAAAFDVLKALARSELGNRALVGDCGALQWLCARVEHASAAPRDVELLTMLLCDAARDTQIFGAERAPLLGVDFDAAAIAAARAAARDSRLVDAAAEILLRRYEHAGTLAVAMALPLRAAADLARASAGEPGAAARAPKLVAYFSVALALCDGGDEHLEDLRAVLDFAVDALVFRIVRDDEDDEDDGIEVARHAVSTLNLLRRARAEAAGAAALIGAAARALLAVRSRTGAGFGRCAGHGGAVDALLLDLFADPPRLAARSDDGYLACASGAPPGDVEAAARRIFTANV